MKRLIAPISLALLIAPGFAAAMQANLYNCSGKDVAVSYSTTSITGQPLINFKIGKNSFSGSGDSIQVQPTVLGNLVTIVKSSIPDFYTDTLTLLVPDVNVPALGASKSFTSRLFATRTYTSIGGPELVEGLIQSNKSRFLNCTATTALF